MQVPTSKEYQENKGICIHKGFRSKYMKMQGVSMVSGQCMDMFFTGNFQALSKQWTVSQLIYVLKEL